MAIILSFTWFFATRSNYTKKTGGFGVANGPRAREKTQFKLSLSQLRLLIV